MDRIFTFIKSNKTKRHYALVVAFGVLTSLLLAYGATFLIPGVSIDITNLDDPKEEIKEPYISPFERSKPVQLSIPKIDLVASFVEPLGLNEDQTVSVPDAYDKVGWYKNGAAPGEVGPSVILGHVDSLTGPAVFFSLGQLEVGDEISVLREDGTEATFVVTHYERVAQEEFPSLDVYGPIDYPGLRLVTCTGLYDRGTLKYSHNLIVYAKLTE
jgi:sortase (surface protein transpeptidase)